MTMRRVLPVFLAAALAVSAAAQDKISVLKDSRLVKEELALAKNAALYFVLDIKGKTIVLKAKGVVLKEWKIGKIRLWGGPPPLAALTVLKKSSLVVPQRIKIMPGEAEQESSTFELDALELKDMPATYTLILESRTVVYIRPRAKNIGGRIGNFGHILNWYVGLPLKNLWLYLKKKPLTMIDIAFVNESEAQSLYWAMADKIKGLIAR